MELESVRQALAAPCHLQVERGPAAGLVLPFAGNYCTLGRDQLHDRAVSREHLLFISQPDKLRVRDLGSANGTFRGATASCFSRISQEQKIGTSSRIRAGSTVLKVSRARATSEFPVLTQRCNWGLGGNGYSYPC